MQMQDENTRRLCTRYCADEAEEARRRRIRLTKAQKELGQALCGCSVTQKEGSVERGSEGNKTRCKRG